MKVILVASDGKQRSFNAPLTGEEERDLFKSIDSKKDKIDAYNTLAAIIGIFRNWK